MNDCAFLWRVFDYPSKWCTCNALWMLHGWMRRARLNTNRSGLGENNSYGGRKAVHTDRWQAKMNVSDNSAPLFKTVRTISISTPSWEKNEFPPLLWKSEMLNLSKKKKEKKKKRKKGFNILSLSVRLSHRHLQNSVFEFKTNQPGNWKQIP